jgi:hypothetical protein
VVGEVLGGESLDEVGIYTYVSNKGVGRMESLH